MQLRESQSRKALGKICFTASEDKLTIATLTQKGS